MPNACLRSARPRYLISCHLQATSLCLEIYASTLDINERNSVLCFKPSLHQHRRMARDATRRSECYTTSYRTVCTYACTPRIVTETAQLHTVSLGEHVKSRHAVQSAPRTRALVCSCTRKPCSAEIYCTCSCNLKLPQVFFFTIRLFSSDPCFDLRICRTGSF